MGADLVVDYEELEASQQALAKISGEFEHTSDRVKANEDIWSNGHVADAMDSFANNWKDNREKLLGKMDDAYKHSDACLRHFRSTDASLAHALAVHAGGSGGGSGSERAE